MKRGKFLLLLSTQRPQIFLLLQHFFTAYLPIVFAPCASTCSREEKGENNHGYTTEDKTNITNTTQHDPRNRTQNLALRRRQLQT